MIVYFDTSALVKAYVAERGSALVQTLIADPDIQPGSLFILEVEMAAALHKAARLFRLDEAALNEAWQVFLADWSAFARIEVAEALVKQASQLAFKYSLRGYDALHLAAALAWQDHIGEPVTLATFDRELWQAALQAGLAAWPGHLAE